MIVNAGQTTNRNQQGTTKPVKPTNLTREELAQRRKAIAEDIGRGESIRAVAEKYGVSIDLVGKACREHGVRSRFGKEIEVGGRPVDKSMQIVAWILGGYTLEEISRDTGLTKQRVSQIKRRAIDAGVFDAVKSLGKGIPESDRGRLDDVTKMNVAARFLEGKPQKAIGREFNLHIATVNQIGQHVKQSLLMKFCAPFGKRKAGPRISRKMQIVKELLDKKSTNAEIAKKLNVHEGFVNVVVREMKDAGIL